VKIVRLSRNHDLRLYDPNLLQAFDCSVNMG